MKLLIRVLFYFAVILIYLLIFGSIAIGGIALLEPSIIGYSLGGIPVSTILLVVGILLFILVTPFVIKQHTRFQGSKEFNELGNKQSIINNFTPFYSATALIRQNYPNEHILSKRFCFSWDIGLVKAGSIPIAPFLGLNTILPFPAILIETDDSYYIDWRLRNLVRFILMVLILIGGYLFINNLYSVTSIPSEQTRKDIIIFSIIGIGWFVGMVLLQSVNIEVIRKSWLSKTAKSGWILTLSGTVPNNAKITLSSNLGFQTGKVASISFRRTFYLL